MKKIVDGKLYDTQTAESLGEWSDNNFNHYSLYRGQVKARSSY